MIDYLHLNTSFSDNLGLINGKSASILYFSSLEDPFYAEDIAYSFLEELLGQVNVASLLDYGNGFAGIGSLINYLHQKELLEESPFELFSEPEDTLIKVLFGARCHEITLSEGLPGIGMYFLFRLRDSGLPEDSFQAMRYKEAIIATIDQLNHLLKRMPQEKLAEYDLSIWHGWSGVYLYLLQAKRLGYVKEKIAELTLQVRKIMVGMLGTAKVSWMHLEAWFTLFQDPDTWQNEVMADRLEQYLQQIKSEPVDFYNAAFYALLLRLLGEATGAASASDQLENFVRKKLDEIPLSRLFSADPRTGAIPMGLDRGLVGTALPLHSLETGNWEWLELLGIGEMQYEKLGKKSVMKNFE
ncbi:hypothetical protein DN752_14495 [Echinicola strongylocentroti]|uniref:Uncharacterized protein n=1 Tax=Echinicola strongylocentroti TaxID=1795355 RepID=A0A2Z4IJU3_9BACT|nr:hypothetical protein [Echinicola strongylocentroti]AWW31234.1 hypothetical protein DN752_14495 [Echinicola strongylocentroti]